MVKGIINIKKKKGNAMDKVQRMAGMPPIPYPRGRNGLRGMELNVHSCRNDDFYRFLMGLRERN